MQTSFQQILHIAPPISYPHYHLPVNTIGNDWAISDIHGCIGTFEALLMQIDLQPSDRLFLLGDYINKGPSSEAVLERILDLLAKGLAIWPLRGNHEQMLINDWKHGRPDFFFASRAMGKPKQAAHRTRYEHFFRQLPYYYLVGDRLLVHAGLDFNKAIPMQDYDSMLNIRGMHKAVNRTSYHIIHGHEPRGWNKLQEAIHNVTPIINIDNGCVNKFQWQMGGLIALEINSLQYIRQECIDDIAYGIRRR